MPMDGESGESANYAAVVGSNANYMDVLSRSSAHTVCALLPDIACYCSKNHATAQHAEIGPSLIFAHKHVRGLYAHIGSCDK